MLGAALSRHTGQEEVETISSGTSSSGCLLASWGEMLLYWWKSLRCVLFVSDLFNSSVINILFSSISQTNVQWSCEMRQYRDEGRQTLIQTLRGSKWGAGVWERRKVWVLHIERSEIGSKGQGWPWAGDNHHNNDNDNGVHRTTVSSEQLW